MWSYITDRGESIYCDCEPQLECRSDFFTKLDSCSEKVKDWMGSVIITELEKHSEYCRIMALTHLQTVYIPGGGINGKVIPRLKP